jgi:hypothetical protein
MSCKLPSAAALTLALAACWTVPVAADQTYGKLTVGADTRLREEYIGNIGFAQQNAQGVTIATANRVFQRYRFRLWGQYAFTDHIALSARLMWEGRHYTLPPRSAFVPSPFPVGMQFENWYSGGVLFDVLALDLKRIANTSFAIKAGRQDVILGNGWLVLDGTPIDGSRTIYLDAIRGTYEWQSAKTTLDLIYIEQDANTDGFPKPLNGNIEDQTEQYETGAIAYLRNKSLIKDTDLDGYFIYKGNDPNYTTRYYRVNNGYPFPSPSDDGEVYAVGARIDSKAVRNWTLRAEAAGEWGASRTYVGAPRANISAFGFNGRALYDFGGSWSNRLHLDLEYLSGDDPNSKTNEAFDPLWGRWPQWSELMIYQWPLDSRVGQATNLIRLNLGWMAKVHPTTELLVDYHALWANEQSVRVPTAAFGNVNQLPNISQNGKFRGSLFTAWVKTKLNKHVSGHLVAEYLAPGSFYATTRQDGSYFLRAEVVLAF